MADQESTNTRSSVSTALLRQRRTQIVDWLLRYRDGDADDIVAEAKKLEAYISDEGDKSNA